MTGCDSSACSCADAGPLLMESGALPGSGRKAGVMRRTSWNLATRINIRINGANALPAGGENEVLREILISLQVERLSACTSLLPKYTFDLVSLTGFGAKVSIWVIYTMAVCDQSLGPQFVLVSVVSTVSSCGDKCGDNVPV